MFPVQENRYNYIFSFTVTVVRLDGLADCLRADGGYRPDGGVRTDDIFNVRPRAPYSTSSLVMCDLRRYGPRPRYLSLD